MKIRIPSFCRTLQLMTVHVVILNAVVKVQNRTDHLERKKPDAPSNRNTDTQTS